MIRNGSITVVDLTDGTDSYLHIAWANDTDGTGFSTSDSTNKLYIGVYSDSNITGSTDYTKYSWTKIKGEPGAAGATGAIGPQGASVVKTEIEYYMKPQGGADPDSSTTGSTNIPNYTPGSTYYKRTVTYLSEGVPFKGNWIQDTGLTNEIKNAYDAWVAAGTAEQRTKKIITDSNGVTVAAGINGADVTEGTTSTYGYNTIMAPNYLGLRYNDINLSKLTTTGLDFYIPTVNGSGKPTQGAKGLSVTSNALTFYNPSDNKAQLIIGANGALQSGNYEISQATNTFASLGTKIDLNYGEIYSPYFRVSQGSISGGPGAGVYITGNFESTNAKIGGTKIWDIKTFTDSQNIKFASMTGPTKSFIQLGNNSSWLLSSNKIHSAWYVEGGYLSYPHFDEIYYDFGINLPNTLLDKFLYIRYNTGTNLDTIYQNDDSWVYKFYIDGNGNLTTTGSIDAHNISIDGVSIAGGSLIAGSLSSYGGSSNRPVYFPSSEDNKGKPVQIAVTDNDSATAVSYTDTNLITARTLYYAGYVKSSGITSVQITATSPVYSSTSTAQTGSSAVTTISLENGYGDTKNPYGSKTKNYVLAAPSNGNGVPSFRSLVASDIPDLSNIYLTSYTETDPVFTASVASEITGADITNWNSKTTNTGTVESVTVQGSNGLTGSGTVTDTGTITISHADTSSQASSSNSERTYIQSITLDGYGHVTGLSTATETVTDTHYTTHLYVGKSNSTGNVVTTATEDTYLRLFDDTTARESHKLAGGNGLTITSDTNGHITFTSPDAFTAVTTVTVDGKNYLQFTKSGGGTAKVSTKNIAVIQAQGATKLVDIDTNATPLTVTGPVKFSAGVPVQMTAANGDSIPWELITGAPNTYTPAAHAHGNITNDGDITATAPTIVSGDQIIINDNSASKITNGPTFDGSTTTKALTPKGTWETFSQFSGSYNDLDDKPTIPTVPSNIVNTITTTAGAHTVISNQKGNVSFNIPTTAAHVGIKFGYTTSGNNRAVLQDSSGNLYVIQKDDNTNYYHTTGSWGGTNNLTYTATANGGAGALAFTLATATTSAYGVTKLSSTASSTEQALAATPKLVYDSINNATNKYVTLNTAQTITAQKTFNTGTRWSVPNSASGSKYGAVNYNADLDALVFSFGTI